MVIAEDEIPLHVLELAGACVQAVANATKVTLDFSQDTLPLLDHYLSAAKGPRDEIVGLVAPMAGAYFGEVLRRALGPAHWEAEGDDYSTYRLRFSRAPVVLNPIGMALEAVLATSVGDVGAHIDVPEDRREEVVRALEVYGDVREDDYYRLSVRFEAIEQVVEALAPSRAGVPLPEPANDVE